MRDAHGIARAELLVPYYLGPRAGDTLAALSAPCRWPPLLMAGQCLQSDWLLAVKGKCSALQGPGSRPAPGQAGCWLESPGRMGDALEAGAEKRIFAEVT